MVYLPQYPELISNGLSTVETVDPTILGLFDSHLGGLAVQNDRLSKHQPQYLFSQLQAAQLLRNRRYLLNRFPEKLRKHQASKRLWTPSENYG